MTEQDIHNLLAYGEHVTLECKKAQSNVPGSLWETYSAFANTYGGTILLGSVYKYMAQKAFLFVTALTICVWTTLIRRTSLVNNDIVTV